MPDQTPKRDDDRFSGLLVDGLARAREAPVTALVCAACVVVTAGLWLTGDAEDWEHLERWGAPDAHAIWEGSFAGLLTSCFVHGDVVHLVMNVWWLAILGRAIERCVAWRGHLALIASAGVVSSAAELAATGSTGIGASGIAYALFGFLWAARSRYPSFRELANARMALWFCGWLVFCYLMTRAGLWNVGNFAHVSGLVFGGGIGLALARPARRTAAASATLLLAAGSTLLGLFSPWSADRTIWRALVAHERGEYEEADRLYRRSLALGQSPGWVWRNVAHLALAMRDQVGYWKALSELERADSGEARSVIDFAEHRASVVLSLAAAFDLVERERRTGDLARLDWHWDRAEEAYRRVLAERPDDPHALADLANLMLFAKRRPTRAELREALELARRAAELTEHRDFDVLDTLAQAWYRNGYPCRASAAARQMEVVVEAAGDSLPAEYEQRASAFHRACNTAILSR